jgi:hypothetical protein
VLGGCETSPWVVFDLGMGLGEHLYRAQDEGWNFAAGIVDVLDQY